MPIEVKELIIKTIVVDEKSQTSPLLQEEVIEKIKSEIVEECLDKLESKLQYSGDR